MPHSMYFMAMWLFRNDSKYRGTWRCSSSPKGAWSIPHVPWSSVQSSESFSTRLDWWRTRVRFADPWRASSSRRRSCWWVISFSNASRANPRFFTVAYTKNLCSITNTISTSNYELIPFSKNTKYPKSTSFSYHFVMRHFSCPRSL